MKTILQRIIFSLLLLAGGAGVASAQQLNMGDVLPLDTAVRVGRLDNGMAYYLRYNAKSAGLADFYIVYDVGGDTGGGFTEWVGAFFGTYDV